MRETAPPQALEVAENADITVKKAVIVAARMSIAVRCNLIHLPKTLNSADPVVFLRLEGCKGMRFTTVPTEDPCAVPVLVTNPRLNVAVRTMAGLAVVASGSCGLERHIVYGLATSGRG